MKTKTVDTRQYMAVLQELVEEGREVSIPVAGASMSPFLADGRDMIRFSKPMRKLRKGDMVFYRKQSGQYVMHRICKIRNNGYYIAGDAQQMIDGPVPEERIFALVTGVKRKGRWIGPGNFWWIFFRYVWIRVIPLRRRILRIYNGVRKWI